MTQALPPYEVGRLAGAVLDSVGTVVVGKRDSLELVLAGMLLAARNIDRALPYVTAQSADDPELESRIEAGKKTYVGYELAGHTLGVVGLGKIGCLVADAAIKLGMDVIGYDPEITVEAAGGGSLVSIAEDVSDGPARLVPQPVRVAGIDLRNHEALRRLALLAEGRD